MVLFSAFRRNILVWLKYFLSLRFLCRIFQMSHCKSDVSLLTEGFFMYSTTIKKANPLQLPSGMRDALAGVTCGLALTFYVKLQGGYHV